jgi:hypothetical protein
MISMFKGLEDKTEDLDREVENIWVVVTREVQSLASKPEALSSNPSTTTQKKKLYKQMEIT